MLYTNKNSSGLDATEWEQSSPKVKSLRQNLTVLERWYRKSQEVQTRPNWEFYLLCDMIMIKWKWWLSLKKKILVSENKKKTKKKTG